MLIKVGRPKWVPSTVDGISTHWALGLAAQSRALLCVGPEAEQMYKSALAHLSETLVTRDLAHARLLYGEWLRRENWRVDAREQLRPAHDFFVMMGAKGFARRAEAELLATGERVRPRAVDNGGTHSSRTPSRLASLRRTHRFGDRGHAVSLLGNDRLPPQEGLPKIEHRIAAPTPRSAANPDLGLGIPSPFESLPHRGSH